MPLYFSYGSNMDRQAMQARCPHALPLGLARLAKHQIFVMEDGYASVRHDQGSMVHGVLYDLPFSDVASLDRYEEVSRGLYRKLTQPILRAGAAPVRALIYVGRDQKAGQPKSDYWAGIVAAARDWALPQAYISYLESLGGQQNSPTAANPRRAIKLKGI